MKLETKKNPEFKISTTKEESKEPKSVDSEVAEVVECLMNAAKSLHKLHLKIKGNGSYAAHNALQSYDKFHDFADDLCEQYQGASEIILEIPSKIETKLNTSQEAIEFLKELKSEITALQSKLTHSEIINLLDSSKEHINSMLYKLKFLS